MEYLPTFARTKSPSYVGKYTSTMDPIGMLKPQLVHRWRQFETIRKVGNLWNHTKEQAWRWKVHGNPIKCSNPM